MLRMFYVLSVAGLLAVASSASAAGQKKTGPIKPKADPVETAFKKFDANNDGQLSKDEFAELMGVRKLQSAAKVKDKKTDALFGQLDADKDGFLSLDEFKMISELLKV